MPLIAQFYGILIRMFFNDHAPAHFHAAYGGEEAVYSIDPLKLRDGKIALRAEKLVLEWAALHRAELLEDWELCRQHRQPHQIKPLD